MTSTPNMRPGMAMRVPALRLKYPMSLGVYDEYIDAQRAVDYLSDNQFAVENCMIVGTELKQMERVTGRLTNTRVALGGALSGAWLGLFIGLIFGLFEPVNWLLVVLSTVAFGVVFGVVWAMVGYAATRGQRDFSSVTQIVATKYEVLVEHRFAQQARELLARMPGTGPALT